MRPSIAALTAVVCHMLHRGSNRGAAYDIPPPQSATRGLHSIAGTLLLVAPTPRKDGQAELTWVTGYVPRWFTHPQMVTHPTTNRVWRIYSRLTMLLIENNDLPLSHTAKPIPGGGLFPYDKIRKMGVVSCTCAVESSMRSQLAGLADSVGVHGWSHHRHSILWFLTRQVRICSILNNLSRVSMSCIVFFYSSIALCLRSPAMSALCRNCWQPCGCSSRLVTVAWNILFEINRG